MPHLSGMKAERSSAGTSGTSTAPRADQGAMQHYFWGGRAQVGHGARRSRASSSSERGNDGIARWSAGSGSGRGLTNSKVTQRTGRSMAKDEQRHLSCGSLSLFLQLFRLRRRRIGSLAQRLDVDRECLETVPAPDGGPKPYRSPIANSLPPPRAGLALCRTPLPLPLPPPRLSSLTL